MSAPAAAPPLPRAEGSPEREAAAARAAARVEAEGVRCAVVGLGLIGSTLMDALAAAGIEAHGYDRLPEAAARYRARPRPQGAEETAWSAGADPAVVAAADVVAVAVRLPVDGAGRAELEPLRSAAALLRAHPRPGRLVLVASTVPPGTTRAFAGWVGGEAFVAHVPERISAGHDWRVLRETPHLVGGVDAPSTAVAARFLARVCRAVAPVSSAEVSELSKLLENAFLSVGIALAGEVARIAHGVGVSAAEVCEAAATKPFGYHAFHPGYGIGGHCLPSDLRLLRAAGRAAGCDSAFLAAAEAAAALQPAAVVDRLEAVLRAEGGGLRGARVLLVGVGFKVGSAETAASPALEVARVLRGRGALPCYLDDAAAALEVDGAALPRVPAGALAGERFAAAVLLAGARDVSASALRRATPVVLDAGGGRIMAGMGEGVHRM